MIGSLKGKLVSSDGNAVLIDVSGVGYEVLVPGRLVEYWKAQKVNDVSISIYTNVRENSIELFGFESSWEKKVFLLLTSVSGVGPRTALSVINALKPDQIIDFIAREDSKSLSQAPGVGKKTAERLVLELKKKVQSLARISVGAEKAADSKNIWNEVNQALCALGYSESIAGSIVKEMSLTHAEVSDINILVKHALKTVSKTI